MPHITGEALLRAAAEHPIRAVYLTGMAVMLAVLVGIAFARPRTFKTVFDDAAIENRTDRRLLLGAMIVTWSVGWPVTLAVIGLYRARRR
jgi:hypothetical protein